MISGKDLEGWITAPDPFAAMERTQNQAYYRDRRERIATAAMVGLIYKFGDWNRSDVCVRRAIEYADALIAELDKPKEVQP